MFCSIPLTENTSNKHLDPILELLSISQALVYPALYCALQRFVPSLQAFAIKQE
jgi:hypothetical protein